MSIHSFQSEALSRGARMLRTAFGPAIARYLEDPAIIEVMLNPDGRLWVDRLSGGLTETTERLSAPDGERIVRLTARTMYRTPPKTSSAPSPMTIILVSRFIAATNAPTTRRRRNGT